MRPADPYLSLGDSMHLKVLEEPCVYDTDNDELYELTQDAFKLLLKCDGTRAAGALDPEPDFLDQCLKEGVLRESTHPFPRAIRIGLNEKPSLRYLMLEVTDRCNLRCRHCYLGEAGGDDLRWETAEAVIDGAEELGLLRLIVTGGEPLLYSHFDRLNDSLAGRSFRSILVTNGTLLGELRISELNFHEIQFSIDGLSAGHDSLRGKGNFERTMGALELASDTGLDVSVATVIHAGNYHELEGLRRLLLGLGVTSWTLEFPVPAGRMADNLEMMLDPERAAPLFEMEWGCGAHEGLESFACGAHLACIDTSGNLVKCGYYRDVSGGDAGAGLREAWRALPKMRLEGACADCDLLAECGSGCRFRAESLAGKGGPDPVMCARFGRQVRAPDRVGNQVEGGLPGV